jgi:hypothetical protein
MAQPVEKCPSFVKLNEAFSTGWAVFRDREDRHLYGSKIERSLFL